MRKVIVDIDNTLWDLASVLYERMRKVNPALVPPSGGGGDVVSFVTF